MTIEIHYRQFRGGRSSAKINGRRTTIYHAEQLVSGKTPNKITTVKGNQVLIYNIEKENNQSDPHSHA